MSFESVECTPWAIFEVPVLHSLYSVLFLLSCLVEARAASGGAAARRLGLARGLMVGGLAGAAGTRRFRGWCDFCFVRCRRAIVRGWSPSAEKQEKTTYVWSGGGKEVKIMWRISLTTNPGSRSRHLLRFVGAWCPNVAVEKKAFCLR